MRTKQPERDAIDDALDILSGKVFDTREVNDGNEATEAAPRSSSSTSAEGRADRSEVTFTARKRKPSAGPAPVAGRKETASEAEDDGVDSGTGGGSDTPAPK